MTYPAAAVLDLLKDIGRDVSGITVSKTAVGDATEGLPQGTDAKVQELAIRKPTWRFGHKKAGAFDETEDEG